MRQEGQARSQACNDINASNKSPTASPNKVSENNLASKLNELKESNKLQTSSMSVSQPISSGSEITRRIHEKIPAPVAKVESQSSEGTGGTLPSQTIKLSDVLKGLEKLGKNKGTGNVDYNVITLQDEVHGTINGKEKTLYPNKNWYAYEYLSKNGTNGMTEEGN